MIRGLLFFLLGSFTILAIGLIIVGFIKKNSRETAYKNEIKKYRDIGI